MTKTHPAYATFLAAFSEAKEKLRSTVSERDTTERKLAAFDEEIIRLRRVVVSLGDMIGAETELAELGITEAVRTVLNNATTRMTLKEVKEGLTLLGFDLNTQKNADASVLAVLNRMLEKHEIRKEEQVHAKGKSSIWFIGPHAK
jgi:hypothetical protein